MCLGAVDPHASPTSSSNSREILALRKCSRLFWIFFYIVSWIEYILLVFFGLVVEKRVPEGKKGISMTTR